MDHVTHAAPDTEPPAPPDLPPGAHGRWGAGGWLYENRMPRGAQNWILKQKGDINGETRISDKVCSLTNDLAGVFVTTHVPG